MEISDPRVDPRLVPEGSRAIVIAEQIDGEALRGIEESPDARWGRGDQVLWASGESLVIAGRTGVGKTTLALGVLVFTLFTVNLTHYRPFQPGTIDMKPIVAFIEKYKQRTIPIDGVAASKF